MVFAGEAAGGHACYDLSFRLTASEAEPFALSSSLNYIQIVTSRRAPDQVGINSARHLKDGKHGPPQKAGPTGSDHKTHDKLNRIGV